MDIELKSFGETLAIGGLASAMLLAWGSMFPDVGRARQILSKSIFLENRFPFVRACLVFALVFASGILIESYAGRVASKRGNLPLKELFSKFLESDKNIRLRALYEVEKYDDNFLVLKLKPITAETLKLKYVKNLLTYQQMALKPAIASASDFNTINENKKLTISYPNVKPFEDANNALYYIAKNIAYARPEFHKELKIYENRYNFAEAICFLGIIGTIGTIFVVVAAYSYKRFKLKESITKKDSVVPVFVLLGSVLLTFGGRSAHIDGRIEHHIRVFGYLKATEILGKEKNQ
jgi:hypothetical protein